MYGGRAVVNDEAGLREYKVYFEDFSKHVDGSPFDLSAVTSVLKKRCSLFTFKSEEDGSTVYKIYCGR